MFMHIWMHWFWITAAYLRGSLLLTISFSSCVSHPPSAEAGLLANDTFPPPHPHTNDSSHSPPLPTPPTSPLPPHPPTTPPPDSPTSPYSPPDSPPDLPDTHPGSPDPLQHPLKKFSKHSHPKFPKNRPKPKPPDDPDTPNLTDDHPTPNTSPPDPHTPPNPTDAPDPTTNPPDHPSDLEIPTNDTLVIENKVENVLGGGPHTTLEPFLLTNRVAAATSAHSLEGDQSDLNAGSITAITLAILVVFSLFGAVSFVLYRRRYLNKPEVLHDKCSNLDSSGYIDETSFRENSEEMYSLDNDSFLNSLEAMTIQNYWTESVKHTKL